MKKSKNKSAALKKLKKQFFNVSWIIDKLYWKRALLYAEYYNLEDFCNISTEEGKNELNKKYDILSQKMNKLDAGIKILWREQFILQEKLKDILKKNP